MQYHDNPYLDLLSHVLNHGEQRSDRTKTGTISSFSHQLKFDLSDGTIPLLTTKRVHLKSIIHELLWFLSGSTDVGILQKNGVTIWDEWVDENNSIGPGYGYQWRYWPKYTVIDGKVTVEHIDQISNLIHGIKTDPFSRRHIVNAWNVSQIDEMKLPPCHYTFQCYVSIDGSLSLKIQQRSCDMFLGVPFNIAQYAILLHLLAAVCDLTPGTLTWDGGDVHIYGNHIAQCQLQLERQSAAYPSPYLTIGRDITDIFDAKYEDFVVSNYTHHERILAPVSK